MFDTKFGLCLVLMAVFAINYAETLAETHIQAKTGPVSQRAYNHAYVMQQFERDFSRDFKFEYHDNAEPLAVYGYSISYFLLLPILALALIVALILREEIAPLRVLCIAVAVDYLVSLIFFLLFPVPERWSFADSGAMLLPDLWSSRLIEAIRPISGLSHCFPSTHVSLTVILICVCYQFHVRFRNTVMALGLTVILSTFVLGIHWAGDIIAGVAVAVLSVAVALHVRPREIWEVS